MAVRCVGGSRSGIFWVVVAWWLGGCVGDGTGVGVRARDACEDADGDGYGAFCSEGPDCNDSDPTLHTGCPVCSSAAPQGCPCDESEPPLDCKPGLQHGADGALVCNEGKRYCRGGQWSECQTAATFQIPAPAHGVSLAKHLRKILPPGAGGEALSACFRNVFPIEDALDFDPTALGETNSEDVSWAAGGGIQNRPLTNEGYAICEPSEDADCDGIPDPFDPFDDAPPFSTTRTAIFLDLEPGESEDEDLELAFQLGNVDVYFLVDATDSMDTALTSLRSQLVSGNFLVDDPTTVFTDESAIDCQDGDFDGSPDNARREQGILGNIQCLIRDAQTGAGWFRQVPFSHDYAGTWGTGDLYGHLDEYAFEHHADISSSPAATQAALAAITTDSTGVSPEAWASALYSIATGEQMYFGWDRPAVPARVDCGSDASEHDDYQGWPCFRRSSVPVVVLLTDATSVDGPDLGDGMLSGGLADIPLDYSDAMLGLSQGSDAAYHPVPYATNEDFATARPDGDIGSIDALWQTQWGNTRGMSADVPATLVCGGGTSAPDAVFAFRVDSSGTYTFNSKGTRFLHSVALFRDDGTVVSDPDGVFSYDSDPSAQLTPLELGVISPGGGRIVTSDNSAWSAGFPREMFTRCFHFNTSSGQANGSDTAPYAEFVFEVSEPMTLDFGAFSTDSGSDKFNVAMALFEGDPLEPEDCTAGVDCGAGGDPDLAGSVDLGTLDGRSVRVLGADTSGAGGEMPDTLFASYLSSNPTSDCQDRGNPVSGTSADHFYDFSLDARTTVAIETSGDSVALTTGWRETLGLIRLTAPAPQARPELPGDDFGVPGSWPIIAGDSIQDAWWQFSGNFTALGAEASHADVGLTTCGGSPTLGDSEPEGLYHFRLTSPASFEFNTLGSDATTELALLEVLPGTSYTLAASSLAGGGSDDSDPFVLDADGAIAVDTWDLADERYQINAADLSTATDDESIKGNDAYGNRCQKNGSGFRPEHVYAFRVQAGVAFDLEVDVQGDGFRPVVGVYEGSISGNSLACASGDASDEASFSYTIASDGSDRVFYVVVEGWDGAVGDYALGVRDADGGGGYAPVDCAIGNALGGDAKLTASLTAGNYAVMVKGSGGSGDFTLNVINTEDDLVGCAYHNLVSNQAGGSGSKLRSYLEQELEPGDYRIVVRGFGAGGSPQDAGPYRVIVKDLEAAPNSVDCHNDALGSDRSFTADLVPGIEYHLVMRGHEDSDSGGSGNYQIDIGSQTRANLQCATATAGQPWVEIQEDLTPGDYFAVIKGVEVAGRDEQGWYQLTVGQGGNADTTPMTFQDNNWDGTRGQSIAQALRAAGVKVIGVGIEGSDPALNAEVEAQLQAVSEASGAIDENGKPITLMLSRGELGDPSSTVLGETIIEGVSTLSSQLSMDVSLSLATTPANPGFGFSYVPIDAPDDGCSGIDLASSPPMHLDCRPGASPRFVLTFENPAVPGHVPLNPDPAQDGYDLRINLLGRSHCAAMYEGGTDAEIEAACGCNDTDADPANDCRLFVADQVPVYIVPSDVVPEIEYAATGQYWQDFGSPGCIGTERPDWEALHYDATLPVGTAITFEACTSDDPDALASCDFFEIATVELDGSCTTEADCACTDHTDCSTESGFDDDGFCVGNTCQVVASPPGRCSNDTHCGSLGRCKTATGVCTWSHDGESTSLIDSAGYPLIDMGAMLQRNSMNGLSEARLRINLEASADQTAAPTLYEWSLLYQCIPLE